MTCQELSSLIRHNCPAVIFILNNRGYTIERMIHDGPYNDIQNWSYSRLPAVFGGENTISLTIKTEDDLEKALKIAGSVRDTLVFAELCLDPFDCSDTLRGLCGKLKARH
jgi:indolepyruvate decarboxylase